MNWWDMPKAEKSEQEREYDRLNEIYTKMFGRSYGVTIYDGPQNFDEIIADIKTCIKTGRPQRLPVIPDNIYT